MVLETYQWLFDGVGGAVAVGLIGFGYRQWRKRQREDQAPSATLKVQGGKAENSPLASGSGIVQRINSPTTVNLSAPAPTVERGCDLWLAFHPTGSRALMIQNSGAEPAFDVVVHIPADRSGFNSDIIHRLPNIQGQWVTCSLNGNFVYLEALRKILAEAVLHGAGNGHEVKAIPVLITYRTRQQQGTVDLEIRLPLRDGIMFALPLEKSAGATKEELAALEQGLKDEVQALRKRRDAEDEHEERIRSLVAPDSGIRAFAKQETKKAQARMGANMLIPFTVEQLVSELGAPQSDIEEALQTLSHRGQAKRTTLPGRWVIFDS